MYIKNYCTVGEKVNGFFQHIYASGAGCLAFIAKVYVKGVIENGGRSIFERL